MADPAAMLIARLAGRGWTLATCESLTGGMLGATLTAVPGASTVYRGGLITYASDLKATLAQVDSTWISQHGVVNERTAAQMADGARRSCEAHWGIATTGVAGPTMQDGQPVGTVWIGITGPGLEPFAQRYLFDGDRAAIRRGTVDATLALLLEVSGRE